MNEEYDIEELAPWLVLLFVLIGGFLRVFLLANNGMWLDETFSVWLAKQSVPDMLQWIIRIDQHPPLYYLLLHYWIVLQGDAPYDVRLLSVFFGTATIPIIYLIGRRLSGALVGLAAAVLLVGGVLERWRFGGSAEAAAARAERHVQSRFEAMIGALETVSQRLANDPGAAAAMLAGEEGARTLFDLTARARAGAAQPDDIAVTVYDAGFVARAPEEPLAWPSALPDPGPEGEAHVPHGITLWGRLFDEATLCRVGAALESVLGVASTRPARFDRAT